MSKPNLTSQKREVFDDFMKGDHIFVHLDSRNPGVVVPAHLGNNPSLSLKLSYLFQGTVYADETGISAELMFSGGYFTCMIPWEPIWAISSASGEQKLWPECMPRELLRELARSQITSIKEIFTGALPFGKGKQKEKQPAEKLPGKPERDLKLMSKQAETEFAAPTNVDTESTTPAESAERPRPKPDLKRIK